ncbi:hypothetical protein VTJ83DRAFT_5315 [Remersonia thermophila]|uniref:Concanavalin A-like lectin/glucanase n=1 Tax=Remersonia thermophila TaxID=72144 RepID=A0ABR4D6L2_9PEZI
MRWWTLTTTLFGATAFLAQAAPQDKVAAKPGGDDGKQLTFSVRGTHKGKPIPKDEIKIKPYTFSRSRPGGGLQVWPDDEEVKTSRHKKVKRANPTANSANWCGSVQTTPSTHQVEVVHAYYQQPSCTLRSGVTTYPQAVAPWVGIDGDSSTASLLQSGTVCYINNSTGVSSHEAWWQWVPAAAYTITSLTVSPGDWIEVTINTTSATSGEITITNLNTATAYYVSINSGPSLARVNADWVVERPYYGSSLSGFPEFSDVWFDDCYATRTSGGALGILGAKQYQIPGLCASQEYDNQSQVSWSL